MPNNLYQKTMCRLAQIPDNSVKFNSEQGQKLLSFASNLIERLAESGEQEKADLLRDTANKKIFKPNPKK